jgi:hypothetical protein
MQDRRLEMKILDFFFKKTATRFGFAIWKDGYAIGSFTVGLRDVDVPNPQDFQDKMNKFLNDYFNK